VTHGSYGHKSEKRIERLRALRGYLERRLELNEDPSLHDIVKGQVTALDWAIPIVEEDLKKWKLKEVSTKKVSE
jgi:hypothetical protein